MKELNQFELEIVSGGVDAKAVLGAGGVASGAVIGGYYGAAITGPIALYGAVMAITNNGILWEAVGLCAAGFVGGVSAGAAVGAVAMGVSGLALGSVVDATMR
tara:strand:- start:71796 stop:72104 length:309 start_codon:yes stop_codon:yes gene_type:complete